MKVLTLVVTVAISTGLAPDASAQTTTLEQQNPVFNPGSLPRGTSTTWTFRTSTDDAVARVLIDSEGKTSGAAPNGYTELALRAQDEIRDALNRVLASSDIQGLIRVMSHSFGYRDDPQHGECRGTQCPDMLEVFSAKNLRVTASGGGSFDVVVGNKEGKEGGDIARRLIIDSAGNVIFPDLQAAPRRRNYACFDEAGTLVSQPTPCDR